MNRGNVFSKRLKQTMNTMNITQSQLCELTGIPKSAMSQYMSGAFAPKQERTRLIAKALNVSELWLLGYDNTSVAVNELAKLIVLAARKKEPESLTYQFSSEDKYYTVHIKIEVGESNESDN